MSISIPVIPTPLLDARRVRAATATTSVIVYGAWSSFSSYSARWFLQHSGIAHAYVDVKLHPDSRDALPDSVSAISRSALPVICIDGEWLLKPTLDELRATLNAHNMWGVSEL